MFSISTAVRLSEMKKSQQKTSPRASASSPACNDVSQHTQVLGISVSHTSLHSTRSSNNLHLPIHATMSTSTYSINSRPRTPAKGVESSGGSCHSNGHLTAKEQISQSDNKSPLHSLFKICANKQDSAIDV